MRLRTENGFQHWRHKARNKKHDGLQQNHPLPKVRSQKRFHIGSVQIRIGGVGMSSIFEINTRLIEAYEMAAAGDYDDETVQTTIEAIEWELEEKADGYAAFIKILKGECDTADNEIKRLQALKQSKQAFADRLKVNLQGVMTNTGKVKFKTPLHTFYIQKNPVSLHIFDDASIPEAYLIPQPPKPDSAAIKEALKNGDVIPGAGLTQGESLRIR
jgi:hypothetical protein